MKIVRNIGVFLLSVALLGLGVLWLLGGGDAHYRSVTEVRISAPAHDVFPWLALAVHRDEWRLGLTDSTPLTPDGVAVGARWREDFLKHGKRTSLEQEVTSLEPDRELALHVVGDRFIADTRYDLVEEGADTLLRFTTDTQYTGFFYRVFEPLVRRANERDTAAELATLKDAVERERAGLGS